MKDTIYIVELSATKQSYLSCKAYNSQREAKEEMERLVKLAPWIEKSNFNNHKKPRCMVSKFVRVEG